MKSFVCLLALTMILSACGRTEAENKASSTNLRSALSLPNSTPIFSPTPTSYPELVSAGSVCVDKNGSCTTKRCNVLAMEQWACGSENNVCGCYKVK